MKKWVCTVCGYVYEGPEAPEICPVCKATAPGLPSMLWVWLRVLLKKSFRG